MAVQAYRSGGFSLLIPLPVHKLRGRYKPFRANSKISYVAGKWHLSPPIRREPAAAGPDDFGLI